jgi:hypothetical protein
MSINIVQMLPAIAFVTSKIIPAAEGYKDV